MSRTAFPPDRTAALERLARFVPMAGEAYARRRNHDLGPGRHVHVSTLSPYLRHRLITEDEVLQAVLSRHSLRAAEKFVQEVFWRTYWKGWLELRPGVWTAYKMDRDAAWNAVQTQSGLRARWEEACLGQTGIDAFDAWARELAETGYMHNHARMWFASIWIFTLRLPWALGADFFLRHLLDGDPASNTLSWRWVAGLQTKGKTYLARPDNIATYTEGRFAPQGLASHAAPLDGLEPPRPRALPLPERADPGLRTGLLLHPDDLSPGFFLDRMPAPVAAARMSHRRDLSPLAVAPMVTEWEEAAARDMTARWADRLGDIPRIDDVAGWARAHDLEQIVTPYAPVGPEADALVRAERDLGPGIRLVRLRRAFDDAAWPHATHGFFRFRERIPELVGRIRGLTAA